jgi:hypothetical protein
MLGLAAGIALVVPAGGDALVTPLVLPLGAAAAGGILGAAGALAAGTLRGGRREAVAEAAPPPPRPVDLAGLPEPAGGPDGTPAPEGWYSDPLGDGEQRWWDGTAWTAHVWKRRRRG